MSSNPPAKFFVFGPLLVVRTIHGNHMQPGDFDEGHPIRVAWDRGKPMMLDDMMMNIDGTLSQIVHAVAKCYDLDTETPNAREFDLSELTTSIDDVQSRILHYRKEGDGRVHILMAIEA